MAENGKDIDRLFKQMLASEEAYLKEKEKLEQAEEARQRQKFNEKLKKAKTQAAKEAAINDENLRRQKKALAELKEQAEADREAFSDVSGSLSDMLSEVADKAEDSFRRIQKAEEGLSDKLKKDASQFREITVLGGNEFAGDFTVLRDYEKETEALSRYSEMLEKIRARGKDALGEDASAFFEAFAKKDVAEGTAAAESLLRASDERFLDYIGNWKAYQRLTERFADDFYASDFAALKKEMEEELAGVFDKVPDSFFEEGRLSALAFGEGFLEEFSRQMAEISAGISAELSGILPAAGKESQPGGNTYHTEYHLATSSDTVSAQLRAISAAEERKKLRGL